MRTWHQYSYFLIVAALLFAGQVLGQAPLKHEKKFFVAEDSTVYWQGHMPVYIFISSSPTGENLIRLNQSNLPQYSNPLYFDTEGPNFIRTRWAVNRETMQSLVPAQEIEFRVENDRIAPQTQLVLKSENKYVGNGAVYYGKEVQGTITSTDGLSGIENIYHSIDKAAFSHANTEFSISTEGEHTVQYYAVDRVGNAEEPQSKIFHIDTTAPKTTLTKSGDEKTPNIFPTSGDIKLTSEDASSGVKKIIYALDEGDKKVTSGKVIINNLKDGQHSLSYYAFDQVGNQEAASQYDFYLDKTPPLVRIDFEGARHKANGKTFIAGPTKVRIAATDNKAGVDQVFYSFDGKNYEEYTKPFLLKKTQKRSWIKFYAIDKVNNKSTAQTDMQVGNIYMDLTAPSLTYKFSGEKFVSRDTTFITSLTNVELNGADTESGILELGYSLDGGTEQVFDGELKVEEEGFHTINFYGKDNVQNMRKDEFFFVVDNSGPEIYYHLSMDAIGQQMLKDKDTSIPVYASHTKLYLAATDKLVGTEKIYYTLDGGTEKLYTEPILTSKAGLRTLTIRAVDKLGNETAHNTIEFVIQ